MSARNFARAFRQRARHDARPPTSRPRAWRRRASRSSPAARRSRSVARQAGFGTVETMRRAFHRRLGVGPADYRARFTLTASRLDHERSTDADRDPAVRPLHRPRRDRALRGALAPARRARSRSSRTEAGPYKTDNGMLTIVAEASLDECPHPDILVRARRLRHPRRESRTSASSAGSARAHETSDVDDVGLHRLAAARRRRRARRPRARPSHWLELETLAELGARPTERARRRAGQGRSPPRACRPGIDMALVLAAQDRR